MVMLFTGANYYPGGGWTDFRGFHANKDAARSYAAENHRDHDWYQVVDSGVLVSQGSIRDIY